MGEADRGRRLGKALGAVLLLGVAARSTPLTTVEATEVVKPAHFLQLLGSDPLQHEQALALIGEHWQEGFVAPLLELLRFSRAPVQTRLIRLLEARTGQDHGPDLEAWYQWLWQRQVEPWDRYADFKAALYRLVDPAFEGYFGPDRRAEIRLDEVVWGGVAQDGIPPLRAPQMIPASEASYLDERDVVFGLEVEGDARAYPKRILAWHEMFLDTVGGVPVAGVYCTLCGSMVLYETTWEDTVHELGTSGFLFRSNKLMYDRATQSLWSTLWGRPVIGPLVGRGIRLRMRSVLTTTWGEWRRRHPTTRVLSLDTGYERDYSEGAAYRDYFATDELMFAVPELDDRLPNKAEVLALRLDGDPDERPLAVSADYLLRHPIYVDRIGETPFVVVTDGSGANRVYATGGRRFVEWDGDRRLVDEKGESWTVSEAALESAAGEVLLRLPAHRAFWFGWYSAFPDTRLVR